MRDVSTKPVALTVIGITVVLAAVFYLVNLLQGLKVQPLTWPLSV
jgi:hypothetical protein